MSSHTAMSSRRRAADPTTARRRQAARRRSVLGVVIAVLALVVATAVLPLAKRVVDDLSLPIAYQDVIREQAAAKHLDPALIAAVIYAETKFDPRTSSAGAEGLMQMLPATALFLAHRSGATSFHLSDLGTPQVNIAYGSYYLRYLLNEYHGSRLMAVAAYNGGEANVDQWAARARSAGARFTIRDIAFSETRAYVQRVLQAQHDYRTTYAGQLGYR